MLGQLKMVDFWRRFRYVANRLSQLGETAMSPSTSTDMTDVDMASIAEDELSEKFSVQGIATGKTSGKTKVVSIISAHPPRIAPFLPLAGSHAI